MRAGYLPASLKLWKEAIEIMLADNQPGWRPGPYRQSLRQGESHMQYVASFERLAKEEGVQQGVQQGVQRGLQQGQAKLLIRLLTNRFGPLPEDMHQRLEQATAEEIDVWADRVLEADSLDQVFDNK